MIFVPLPEGAEPHRRLFAQESQLAEGCRKRAGIDRLPDSGKQRLVSRLGRKRLEAPVQTRKQCVGVAFHESAFQPLQSVAVLL
jgi:hypothetical protein